MYIAIEGVIGVGTPLSPAFFKIRSTPKSFWRYLKRIHFSLIFTATKQYAFQTHILFLLSHSPPTAAHRERNDLDWQNLFADYTFAKDALFARINLKGDQLDMYYKVHEALAEKIQKPDLLVYLQASTDILMQRIALRDRPYERQMERSYIDDLNHAYDDFFAKPFDHTPVLTVDTDHLNFIQNPEDLKLIENRIRQSLSLPPFQQTLPLPEA